MNHHPILTHLAAALLGFFLGGHAVAYWLRPRVPR
jgi:hypothetical protein